MRESAKKFRGTDEARRRIVLARSCKLLVHEVSTFCRIYTCYCYYSTNSTIVHQVGRNRDATVLYYCNYYYYYLHYCNYCNYCAPEEKG